MKRLAIIGGGVAGLAAALAAKRAADGGYPVEWTLIEKDDRLGGKILTEQHGDFIVDGGPDCYLAEKPWVSQMAARLGIVDRLLPTNDTAKHTFIYRKGRLHELPDGIMMMVPTKLLPLATTSLFSISGKLRMAMDLFIPPRKADGDETLASFVRRRLGTECLSVLAEPMVGGVHASDPEQMSLQATFPRFLQMEQRYGSLIRGFLAARRHTPLAPLSKTGAPQRTYFMSFKGGMQELTDAMAKTAGPHRLSTAREVLSLELAGNSYLLRLNGDQTLVADCVIIAAEAYQAAHVLRGLDDKLASTLEKIEWTSAATVSLGFSRDLLGHDLHGFGFLVPSTERRRIMATTWSSTKWLGRAAPSHALIRAFVGGPHNGSLVQLPDNEMIAMVRKELRSMMGITAEPELARVYRWVKGMPQYTVGHLDRLAEIDRRLASHPGLFLCGASYRGVGMGDCMYGAEQAVARALGE